MICFVKDVAYRRDFPTSQSLTVSPTLYFEKYLSLNLPRRTRIATLGILDELTIFCHVCFPSPCTWVCMCEGMHVCLHMDKYVYMPMSMCICICVHTGICVYMSMCMYVHMCVFVFLCPCVYLGMYVCRSTSMCAACVFYVYVSVCVCVYGHYVCKWVYVNVCIFWLELFGS